MIRIDTHLNELFPNGFSRQTEMAPQPAEVLERNVLLRSAVVHLLRQDGDEFERTAHEAPVGVGERILPPSPAVGSNANGSVEEHDTPQNEADRVELFRARS